jgi:MYXO-CTERM domain-containing protein
MTDTCDTGTCAGMPLDADNDGAVSDACTGGTDCDDGNAAVNPDASEICDDSIDNDCNGDTDGDDTNCQGCPDSDGDGFASDACGGTDCDDTNDAINPDAMEMCSDGVDNDCNDDVDLDDETCKRPATGCDCSTQGSTTPTLLLGLLGLLLFRRRRKKDSC